MPTAAWSLQQAMYAALAADSAVLAALGGARIHDDVPQGEAFPYLTFAGSVQREWSTATEEGHEHVITLHVWSQSRSRAEVLAIAAAVRTALDDAPLDLDGHHLVNLRHEVSETRRGVGGDGFQGILRFRAVTEPA